MTEHLDITEPGLAIPLLEDVFSAIHYGLALLDEEMRHLLVNPRYTELVSGEGHSPQIGHSFRDFLADTLRTGTYALPDGVTQAQIIETAVDRIHSHGEDLELERTDGRFICIASKKTALGGHLVTVSEITQHKRTEAVEAARWQAVNDAVGALQEGFSLWDADMRFMLCNDQYMDMVLPGLDGPIEVGTSAETMIRAAYQSGLLELPATVTEDAYYARVLDWVQSYGAPWEIRFKDGRIILTSINRTDLGGYLLTALDITEERNTEIKARDMLYDAFQALDEGLVLCDENMRYVFGNTAWKRMMFEDFPDNVPAPGDDVIDNLIRHVQSGYYAIPERMDTEAFIGWMMGEMAQHGKQVPYASANGCHFIGSSHKTAFGGSLMFVRDVTRQRAAETELEKQREITHQNEKLSALGELLAGVAHELNNPLSVVFGYAQMLQGRVEDPVRSERVDLICQSAERAAKIVRTFLAMARQRPTKIAPCCLNDVVMTALDVSSYALKANGTQLVVDLGDDDMVVQGDFDQLAQVFSNLIVNAGHAVEDQGAAGQITIRHREHTDHHEIEIRDTGPGIPEDILKRIFEPFFTTKEVGEGTGIGLAFSHRIVTSHGGMLTVETQLGQGTSFVVSLEAEPEGAPERLPVTAPPKGGQTVLVVDDEAGIARLLADLLSEEGYVVTQTTHARAALAQLKDRDFDVILSDFKMPEINGETFYRALEAISPNNASRTGFVTGDAMSHQVRSFLSKTKRPYIEKPINRRDLLALVRQISEAAP